MTATTQTYQAFFVPTPKGFENLWASARKSIHEEGIIDFVSKLSPWIAPLPSAWFVHDATVRHLAAGSALAWIIAVVIETLGLTTTHTALGMHAWNKAHASQPEKQAPFGLSVILAVVYVVATLMLITVLEVAPNLQHYAPAMFPILAVVGAVNLALRSHHNSRVRLERSEIEETKQRLHQAQDEDRAQKLEEKRLRAMAKYGMTVNPAVTSTVPHSVTLGVDTLSDIPNATSNATSEKLTMPQRQAAIKAYLASNKDPGASALGRMFGVDRKTIYRDLEAIKGQ